jgi:hypothetical protein
MADKFYKMIESIAARISLWAWKKRARIFRKNLEKKANIKN